MKILIVEDNRSKREFIEFSLKEKHIDWYSCRSIRPAIQYAIDHYDEIDGIILDLALSDYDYSPDYSITKGLDLVYELTKRGIKIPILINSSIFVNTQTLRIRHKNVQEFQMSDDEHTLKRFIDCLKKKK